MAFGRRLIQSLRAFRLASDRILDKWNTDEWLILALTLFCGPMEQNSYLNISVRDRSWVGLEEESVIRAFDYGLFVDMPDGICMNQECIIMRMFGT